MSVITDRKHAKSESLTDLLMKSRLNILTKEELINLVIDKNKQITEYIFLLKREGVIDSIFDHVTSK